MFDLAMDPQEMTSIHEEARYASIRSGLEQRLMDLRQFYDVNKAVIPATRGDEKWWRDRDRLKSEEAKKGEAELLFIGDSITQGWEDRGEGDLERTFCP